ncbi:MAG: hypothetical protein R2711_06695 [Acidimicrobiales bacterium]
MVAWLTPPPSTTGLGSAPMVLPADGRACRRHRSLRATTWRAWQPLVPGERGALQRLHLAWGRRGAGRRAARDAVLALAAVALVGLYAITRQGERRVAEALAGSPGPSASGPAAPPIPPEAARVVSALGVNVPDPVAYDGARGPVLDRRTAG